MAMQQQGWEYQRIVMSDDDLTAAALNALGADGWELAGMAANPAARETILVMKRSVAAAAAPSVLATPAYPDMDV